MRLLFTLIPTTILLFASLPAFASVDFLTSEENIWLHAHRDNLEILFGYEAPPNAFHDESGDYVGLLVDFQHEVESLLGVTFRMRAFAKWDELIEYSRTGNNFIIVGIAETSNRSEFLVFTSPFVKVPYVIVTRDSSEIQTVSDLASVKVCTVADYAINDFLAERYPDIKPLGVKDNLEGLRAVSTGQFDAMVLNQMYGSYLIESQGLSNLKIAGESGYLNRLCAATSREDTKLFTILEKAIDHITPDKRHEIYQRWVSGNKEALSKTALRWIMVGTLILIVLLIGSWGWGWSLKRGIRKATAQLEKKKDQLNAADKALRTTLSELEQRVEERTAKLSELEKKQRESATRYLALINSVDDGIWLIDRQHRCIAANSFASNYFQRQYGVEIVSGMTPKDVVPQKEAAEWTAKYDRGLSGESILFEWQARGGYIFSVKIQPTHLDDEAIGLSVFARDITEFKNSEEALRESEERFRSMFEENRSVMFILDPSTGQIVDANPAACSYYGYDKKNLTSLQAKDINATLNAQEMKDRLQGVQQEALKQFEATHRLASGELRHVEAFTCIVSLSGKPHIHAIIHDITDRKRVEKQLSRYQLIIDSTPDLISLVDRTYTYRMVNNAYLSIFNKSREEIEGKFLVDMLGKEFFESRSKPILDRVFAGETVQAEQTLRFPQKEPVHMDVSYHPVPDSEGNIEFVAVDARDVTQLKSYADRLTIATQAGQIGIWEWDIPSDSLRWDDMMRAIYQIEPDDFTAMYDAWRSRVHPDDLARVEQELAKTIAKGAPFDTEFRINLPDGNTRCIKAAALAHFQKQRASSLTGVNWDVTELREIENELRRLATTDPLTGANNRRHFMEHAETEIKRSRRYDTPMVILSLDIDHFKSINDTYGHHIGDDVLKALVEHCHKAFRTSDIFGRLGGEEFSAVLPQTDIDGASIFAERLRVSLAELRVQTDETPLGFTVSIGLAELQPEDSSIDDILKRADEALYAAKNNGRNRVEKA